MNRLVIIGAGGHGKVIADTATSLCKWSEIVFLDDRFEQGLRQIAKWQVIGPISQLTSINTTNEVVIGIGNNVVRENLFTQILQLGLALPSVIHPTAYISPYSKIDCGTVVFAQAVVNIDAHIGRGCIINTAATIDHDCRIADFCHLSPGVHLAGATKIGQRSWLGIGSVTKQLVEIGQDCVIGAGAAVVQNVYNGTTVVGVPAHLKS